MRVTEYFERCYAPVAVQSDVAAGGLAFPDYQQSFKGAESLSDNTFRKRKEL